MKFSAEFQGRRVGGSGASGGAPHEGIERVLLLEELELQGFLGLAGSRMVLGILAKGKLRSNVEGVVWANKQPCLGLKPCL